MAKLLQFNLKLDEQTTRLSPIIGTNHLYIFFVPTRNIINYPELTNKFLIKTKQKLIKVK